MAHIYVRLLVFTCSIIIGTGVCAETPTQTHSAQENSNHPPNTEIETLIQKLGSESYLIRESAQTKLLERSGAIAEVLHPYLDDLDPERRRRVREIYTRMTHRLTCAEVEAYLEKAVRNNPRIEEMRNALNLVREALSREVERQKEGKNLEQYQSDGWEKDSWYDPRYKNVLYPTLVAIKRKESQQRSLGPLLDKVLHSSQIRDSGIRFVRSSLEPGNNPKAFARVQESTAGDTWMEPYFAEVEMAGRRLMLSFQYTGITAYYLDDAGAASVSAITERDFIPKLEPGAKVPRALLLPNGELASLSTPVYEGGLRMTYPLYPPLNIYLIDHIPKGSSSNEWASHFLKSEFPKECKDRSYRQTDGARLPWVLTSLSADDWIPFHGTETDLKRTGFPTYFERLKKRNLHEPN